MTNPSELLNSLVMMLRSIPEVVASMDGDEEKIFAFEDSYPDNVNLFLAIHQMPVPGVMVAWQGTDLGTFGGGPIWKHHLSVFLRVGKPSQDDDPDNPPARTFPALMSLLLDGKPEGSDIPMIFQTVHDGCDPMDPPSTARQTGQEGLDYFEMSLTFTDKGA